MTGITLTIDGKQITVEAGATVIQAAEKLGVFVPRYCYHPGLSIAGNCRICLVEVEKNPKLQIACNMPVAEGMVVDTKSQRVTQGREAVLEFLLANHPLDCPVCDQSGECDLQNFYMAYGLYNSRFQEKKVKKPKAVPIGPAVMLDAERCILCSRCVRFTDEITKTGEFGIFNRGDKAQIGLYPDKTLDNKYSGNVVDICPVGALTDRDFRFKARVWYLSTSPSVCNGCSRGCNIDLHFVTDRPHLSSGARVMRVKPRTNPDVNQWWICDEGRYGYKFIDEKRLRKVLHRGIEVTWEKALEEFSSFLSRMKKEGREGELGVIASTQLTTEELYLIRRIFKESLGVTQCVASMPTKPGYSDNFLIQADKSPNTAGAVLLGLTSNKTVSDTVSVSDTEMLCTASQIVDRALAGTIKALWVFGIDIGILFGGETLEKLSKGLELFVFQGSNENATSQAVHWVLPTAVYAEKDGTFVNCAKRVQRIVKAFPPPKDSKADWEILLELAKRAGVVLDLKSPEEIFAAMGQSEAAFKGLTYEKVGLQGASLRGADAIPRPSLRGGL